MNDKKADNGVNVAALLGAREALTAEPAGAKFTWRATCKWINGTHSQSTVGGFYGLGAESSPSTPTIRSCSHPKTRDRRRSRSCSRASRAA
jgi:hypothetical protein